MLLCLSSIPIVTERVCLPFLAGGGKADFRKDITISPRVADGNSEPSLDREKRVILTNSDTNNSRYSARWDCFNCRDWKGGRLNVSDEKQRMIFAVGPRNIGLDTSDPDAALRRHDWYGGFEINMKKSLGDNIAFEKFRPTKSDGASEVGDEVDDHDFASPAHAVFMVGAFVILFPFGIIWLRIFGKVWLHWLTQAVGVLAIFIGAGIGIVLSKQYNRVRNGHLKCKAKIKTAKLISSTG